MICQFSIIIHCYLNQSHTSHKDRSVFFCQGANSSFFTLFLAHGNNATINFCSQDCKSCQFGAVSLDITSNSEVSTAFWRLWLNIFKTNSYVTGYFHRSTRKCKAHLVWPTHTIHNLLQVNIYYVTIVNLFSFHIGNMSQEKCHEKVGSRTKKLKSSERLASLSWSTWYIAPQVFVQLLENGLNPPSPQQASCYLRRSKHVSHSALFQASGR